MILTEQLLAEGVCALDDLEQTAKAGAALAEMVLGLADAIDKDPADTVPKKAVVGSLRDLLQLAGFAS